MSLSRFFIAVIGASVLLAGCAKPPHDRMDMAATAPISKPQGAEKLITASTKIRKRGYLAGRNLYVGSINDLKLRDKEVILTFDDGPSPKTTPLILAALKKYGAKATFFMVGEMATYHPQIARQVAREGHTIGSHTHGHENLARLKNASAHDAISHGESVVASVIAPTGKKVAPFFRFPYLAHTQALRADLAGQGIVIFDVDVDSLDFKKVSPAKVLERTLARLERKGKGIVLFHDIHMRTVRMMPEFLAALEERGYKVVNAVPKRRGLFDKTVLAALQ